MTTQEKINNRIHFLSHKIKMHEICIERCMNEGTEKGIEHNELMIKQLQDEIDFLEDLLD